MEIFLYFGMKIFHQLFQCQIELLKSRLILFSVDSQTDPLIDLEFLK